MKNQITHLFSLLLCLSILLSTGAAVYATESEETKSPETEASTEAPTETSTEESTEPTEKTVGDISYLIYSDHVTVTGSPVDMTSIGHYAVFAFMKQATYYRSPAEVVIPAEVDGLPVTEIDANAFEECLSLISITLPNSVISIGDHAFLGCKNLAAITIPDSVTSIGEAAFYGCSSLTTITIPDGVNYIGDFAFGACSSLAPDSITIPDGVTNDSSTIFSESPELLIYSVPNIYENIEKWDEIISSLEKEVLEALEASEASEASAPTTSKFDGLG